MLRIQSNGIGQQSMALYFMSCLGLIPRFDYSIFADPGREKRESYEYLRYVINWSKQNDGIPIIWAGKKSLYRDLIRGTNSTEHRFVSIPAYTKNPDGSTGILQRQCTEEYKIAEFNKTIRMLLKLGNRNFPAAKIYNAITIEELDRVAAPDVSKFINVYPFCNLEIQKGKTKFLSYDVVFGKKLMTRSDCVNWLRTNGFEVPPKSACTFCPYQSDRQWLDLKNNHPKEWNAIVRLDGKIRNASRAGVNNPIFLHRSLKPLGKVDLRDNQTQIFKECAGNCDV